MNRGKDHCSSSVNPYIKLIPNYLRCLPLITVQSLIYFAFLVDKG